METLQTETTGIFALGGDLTVNRLGYGAMRITGDGIWGEPKNRDEARKVLRKAVELGVNFIDTADSYGPEVSENIIAEALYPYDKNLVIATKGGLTRYGPNKWEPLGRPEYLRQCVEMSLRRLKVERIDLYQLHTIDAKVPVEESLGVLKDFQKAGKIRHIGLSNVSPEQIDRCRKTVKVVSVQNQYNLNDRRHEKTVKYCEQHHLGFIPWFPVAAGKLAQPGGPLDEAAKRHEATIVTATLPCDASHSRNLFGEAPGREYGGGQAAAFAGGVEDNRKRRQEAQGLSYLKHFSGKAVVGRSPGLRPVFFGPRTLRANVGHPSCFR
jgi:pyridoxine 4-dehydrogenase